MGTGLDLQTVPKLLQPYSKSRLELESNLSKIYPINSKFISKLVLPKLNLTKLKL